MKKGIAILLAFIYLTTSSGMVINVQYCFEKVSSVKIEGFGKHKSCCTNTTKKLPCCSNEYKIIKAAVSEVPSTVDFKFVAPVYFIITSSFGIIPNSPILAAKFLPDTNTSPPFKERVPIYIKNCVFRI